MPRVNIVFNGDKTPFDQAVKGVKAGLHELKGEIAGLVSVGAIIALTEKTIEFADATDKASLRMKLTTAQVQALSIVANDTGSSLEKVEMAFKKIELAKAKALAGDKNSLNAFAARGIDTDKLSKSNTIELANILATSKGKDGPMPDNASGEFGLNKVSRDLQSFGDSLNDFDQTIAKLQARGAIMSDEDIANLAEAKDELELLSKQAMAGFAPIISGTIDFLQDYYILFKSYWSNIFATIITLASDTVDYIKTIGSSLKKNATNITEGAAKGAVFGPLGMIVGAVKGATDDGSLKKAQDKFLSDVKNDIGSGVNGFVEDVQTGREQREQEKAERAAKRAKDRKGVNMEDDDTTPKAKASKANGGKGFYSDSLTSSGNMLGASFANVSQAIEQMNLMRQANDEAKKQSDLLKKLVDLNTSKNNDPFAGFA